MSDFNLKEYLQQADGLDVEEYKELLEKQGQEMTDYFTKADVAGIMIMRDKLPGMGEQTQLFQHAAAVCLKLMEAMPGTTTDEQMLLTLLGLQEKVLCLLIGMALTMGIGVAAEEEWR